MPQFTPADRGEVLDQVLEVDGVDQAVQTPSGGLIVQFDVGVESIEVIGKVTRVHGWCAEWVDFGNQRMSFIPITEVDR